MAQSKEDMQKIAGLNSAFVALNDSGKNCALAILRTLSFAQSVMRDDLADAAGGSQTTGPE